MKSRITIEVDFENGNQPVIQILKENSDDVRDRLVSNFTQQFGGSSWCKIKWVTPETHDGSQAIFISPIRPEEFKEQSEMMIEQWNLNEKFRKEYEKNRVE